MTENRQDEDSGRKVLDAEIVDSDVEGRQAPTYQRAFNANGPFIIRTARLRSTGGCSASIITVGIALICLGQYGFLAAIGFYVFYLIGGLIGIFFFIRKSASLMLTAPPSFFWAWRICNWMLSYLLAAYLAGGFDN